MITNAIQDILQLNPDCIKERYSMSSIFPIHSTSLGGILLFNEPLEEDPNKYYAPPTNQIIGYSNTEISGSDEKRGSYNSFESGYLNDEKTSYKYVYDFNTAQGNGIISALALTSDQGGAYYLGSLASKNKASLTETIASSWYDRGDSSTTSSNALQFIKRAVTENGICALNPNKNICYSVFYPWTANKLTIQEIHMPFTSIGIQPSPSYRFANRILKTTTIQTEHNFGIYLMMFPDDYDNPTHLWGVTWESNSSGDATINWIKINLNDYSFTEGDWIIPNVQLFQSGNMPLAARYNEIGYGTPPVYVQKNCIIYKNNLYCFNYSLNKIYRISLENPVEAIEIISGDGKQCRMPRNFSKYDSITYSAFNIFNETVFFMNGYIVNDKYYTTNIETTATALSSLTNQNGFVDCAAPGLKYGPYLFTFYNKTSGGGNYSDWYQRSFYLYAQYHVQIMKAYLATINNLETPIEKTNDKTMKITYILTEVEDEE